MKFLLLILVTLPLAILSPSVLKVPQEYSTIQDAINSAVIGDTVLVSNGRYFENINFNGKNIVVTSNYIFSQDPLDIDSTIIDGSQPVSPDSASCVRIVSGEDSTAQLIGFILTGGKGTRWIDEHGAGTYWEGGGILIALSSPVIKYNKIVNNEAVNRTNAVSAGGGGIRAGDGNPVIEGNYIAYNKGRYGGGLVLNYTGALVRNNIFYQNSGGEDYGGGGIWVNRNSTMPKIIVNNTIIYNSSAATKGGGGLYVWSTSVVFKNNIVHGNSGGTTPSIKLVSTGSVSAEYNLIEGGYSGTGNIDGNPLLKNDFTLMENSQCIDAGDTNFIYNDIEDTARPGFAKLPSLGTIRNDMGAFGGPHIISYSQILTPVNEDESSIPQSFKLMQNYPNPFNPSTSIKYSIPDEGYVKLIITNLIGEEVAVLVSEYQQTGTYTAVFNAENLSSGMYLYQLRAGDKNVVQKMLLVK